MNDRIITPTDVADSLEKILDILTDEIKASIRNNPNLRRKLIKELAAVVTVKNDIDFDELFKDDLGGGFRFWRRS